MTPRTFWCLTSVATAFLIGGVALSHSIEPDISVSHVTLAGNTPALRFMPAQPGPHPVALLAHGSFCSKEMFFRYGEALAHAGFECFAIDFPGHGESPQPFSVTALTNSLAADARAIGPVDVFAGHSMGGYVGGRVVNEGRLHPRLFIAIGSLPRLARRLPRCCCCQASSMSSTRRLWFKPERMRASKSSPGAIICLSFMIPGWSMPR
jgi:pimeloyl-ACP methyl ester carboxylesterase